MSAGRHAVVSFGGDGVVLDGNPRAGARQAVTGSAGDAITAVHLRAGKCGIGPLKKHRDRLAHMEVLTHERDS
jgi:hypothetical protein